MKCLFIIDSKLKDDQIENQYLLMIAMLNFDYEVNVIFIGQAHKKWQTDPKLSKHLAGLSMYGAKKHSLTIDTDSGMAVESGNTLSMKDFIQLKNDMDFIT